MTLEWLRRRDPVLDEQLREWLFTDRAIGVDADAGGGAGADATTPRTDQTLGIGALFGEGTL